MSDKGLLNRLSNGGCHTVIFENEKRYKIEECRPQNCLKWGKNFGRNDGGYTISGLVKTIDEVEDDGRDDDDDEKANHA